MWAAADQNNVDVLDALIAAGADTSVKDNRGATILQVARSRAGENLKKQDAVRFPAFENGKLVEVPVLAWRI